MRVKMVVAYDGTNYSGWQIQPNGVTIEQKLNEALQALLGEDIRVTGASRTDAGVHSLGNVCIFDTDTRMPAEKISYALNQRLPEDIVVQDSCEVPDTFHPQVLSWERDMLTPAFLALIYDHPELSWLSGATYYMSYKINGISYYSSELDENNSMVKDVTVPCITTYIKEPSVDATKAEIDTIVSEATESINKRGS